MKIGEAKRVYSSQLDILRNRRRELSKLLEEDAGSIAGSQSFDRVELSRELEQVDAQYKETSDFMEQVSLRETCVHNAVVAQQQGEAMADAMDDMIKCLEIARRIMSGGKVPSTDEKKLMEYSQELYMAAKNMSFLRAQERRREYDALFEEEEAPQDPPDASEIADNAEVPVDPPAMVSQEPSDSLAEA